MMIIPSETDPNWVRVIIDENHQDFDFLATRILVGRLGLTHYLDPSPETTKRSVVELREFFVRNKDIPKVQADLEKIFGNKVSIK